MFGCGSGTAEESVETRRTHRNVSDNFTDVSEKLHRPLLADDTQSEAVTSTDDELFREAPEPLFPELSGVGDADVLVVESEHAGTNKNLDPPCGGVTTTSAGRRSEHTSAGWGDQRPQRARTANVHTQTRVRTANIRMQVGSSINSAVKTADVQTEQTGEPLPKIPLLKPKVVTVELPAPPPQVITKTLYKDKIKIIQVIRELHHFADGTEETHDQQSRTDEFETDYYEAPDDEDIEGDDATGDCTMSEFVSDDDLDRLYNGDYLSEEGDNDVDASGGD